MQSYIIDVIPGVQKYLTKYVARDSSKLYLLELHSSGTDIGKLQLIQISKSRGYILLICKIKD